MARVAAQLVVIAASTAATPLLRGQDTRRGESAAVEAIFPLPDCFELNNMPDFANAGDPSVVPDGLYRRDDSRSIFGQPTWWADLQIGDLWSAGFIFWCPPDNNIPGASRGHAGRWHYECYFSATPLELFQEKVENPNCFSYMHQADPEVFFGNDTWFYLTQPVLPDGPATTRETSCEVEPLVVESPNHYVTKTPIAAAALPWFDGYSLMFPDMALGAGHAFSLGRVIPADTPIAITCNVPVCDVQLFIYHYPGLSGEVNGDLTRILPEQGWQTSSRAPVFRSSSPDCTFPMTAFRFILTQNDDSQQPQRRTARTLSESISVVPEKTAMYLVIAGGEGRICSTFVTEATCMATEAGVVSYCKWMDGECVDTWKPTAPTTSTTTTGGSGTTGGSTSGGSTTGTSTGGGGSTTGIEDPCALGPDLSIPGQIPQ